MNNITRSLKHISATLALLACIFFVPLMVHDVYAAEEVASGPCGDNLTWVLDDEDTLTITGTGEMPGFKREEIPWRSYSSGVKRVIVQEGVTSIGSNAFFECSSLTSVTITEGVKSIGWGAFYGCSSLPNVAIPDSVTSIDDGVFMGSGLTRITIPSSVTSIGSDTFHGCSNLLSVTIPDGVKSIGMQAFTECSSLASITIPSSVTSIGNRAFLRCSSLQYVFFEGSESKWNDYHTDVGQAIVHFNSVGHAWNAEPSIDIEPSCTRNGSMSIHCARCNAIDESTVQAIPAIGHSYGDPIYAWADDYSTVTASMTCGNDSSHVISETAKISSEVTKPATYTTKGETTYTAAFNNKSFYAQTKTVANIDKLPKVANTLTVTPKRATIKASKIKKKKQNLVCSKILSVSKPQGAVSYKLVGVTKAKFKKYFTINASTGKVTIKKGLKKGTYKVKVTVSATGNTQYNAATKTVTFRVKIR